MYLYKPIAAAHNLMQTIARVNRVFTHKINGTAVQKEVGLIVDYIGIASALKQAMKDYTRRDRQNYGEIDIAKTVLPKFTEKLEVCRDLFHGFNYSAFLSDKASDYDRTKIINGGVNFLSAVKKLKQQETFVKEAQILRQSLSLCSSIVGHKERFEAAFFESVRTSLIRLTGDSHKLNFKELNAYINEFLKNTIKSEGVIDLFSDAVTGFSIFDPVFLTEIASMKEKNLAVEILKKLPADQVSSYRRTSVVKSEKFSEMLSRTMKAYFNGLLTNEEVIARLLEMAEDIANAHAEGKKLGLS
jgi:type I restriction enzyme R subunit